MSLHDSAQSLLWIVVTVACYFIGLGLRRIARHNALANPVLVAVVLVASLLLATHTPYAVYFRATWLLTFLLAPATVALGVPLARNFAHVRQSLRGVLLGLFAGSITSMVSGVLLVRLLGGSKGVALSMLPKAATTPIAIAVASQIGGEPALTAALAIVGGIVAAMTLRAVLGGISVTHGHAMGLAAGTAGSGIAGAHAALMGDAPAAFAAIGIGMNGLLTALLAPLVAALFNF
jgi:putative effector of murein hydrolase